MRANMKNLVLPLLTITVLVILTGCKPSSETPGQSEKKGKKPRIALVMKSLANEFFLTMENGARAHQKANADVYDLIANGIKDELDVSRQIEIVEQMIAQKVDAIVIAPADSKALIPVCKKAMQAGIVVVNIDNKFDEEVLQQNKITIPFVGPNNRLGALKVAEYVAKRLKPGDKVAIIEGAPNAFNAVQRKLGFNDAIRMAKLNLVSSQSGYWETDKANKVASAIINEHPDLKAIFCANDSMAIGAVTALRDAGKLGQVLVAGYDNISAVQQLIKEGKIIATADQHADKLAVYGIEYALQILKEKTTPMDFETPVDLITAEKLTNK